MNKFLALAAAGVVALATTVAATAPSYAAPNWQQGQGQGQQWKKFQGQGQGQGQQWRRSQGQSWQAQKNFGNNSWKGQQKFQGQKKFSNFQGQNKYNGNWKKNWQGPKQQYHGNYPQKPFKKYTKYPKHHHYNNFVGPFVFGLALGAIANNAYAYDAGLSAHELWCLQAYPNTYNPRTNTFYVRPGVVAVCVSPYGGGPIGYLPY